LSLKFIFFIIINAQCILKQLDKQDKM